MNELHERSSITSRHARRYIIIEQPQPGCVNLEHAGCTNNTYHRMTLMSYHLYHSL
jgi:hypothetical protein